MGSGVRKHDMVEAQRHAAFRSSIFDTGPIGDGDDFPIHRMQAPRRPQGIRQLAAYIGDFGYRQERRHRQHAHQREDRPVERPIGDKPDAGHDDNQPAQPGGGFQNRGLNRQITEKWQAQGVMRFHPVDELTAPVIFLLKRRNFTEALNGVDAVRVQIAQRFARPRPQRVDTPAHEKRAEAYNRQKRRQRRRHLPTERRQRDQHRRWNQ